MTCHKRNACWIPKTSNKQSEYILSTALPLLQRLPDLSVMLKRTLPALLNTNYFHVTPAVTLRESIFPTWGFFHTRQ